MFKPIKMKRFLALHKKANSGEDMLEFRAALTAAVKAKKAGAVCSHCGAPIWAIGSAVSGWNACFTCITGEADDSEDYEILEVCW